MTILDETNARMEQTFTLFCEELNATRTNRADPALVERIEIEAYGGTRMRLREVAAVTASALTLIITPFDPQLAGAIKKGIDQSNLGFHTTIDGNLVRVTIPQMSEQIRKEVIRGLKERAETAKVAIREHRKRANNHLQKEARPEDEQKGMKKQIQERTDHFCSQIEIKTKAKEQVLLEL